jgi:hypothetical protein
VIFGDGALAVQHHLVDQLGDDDRLVDRVRNEFRVTVLVLTGHRSTYLSSWRRSGGTVAVLHANNGIERAAMIL